MQKHQKVWTIEIVDKLQQKKNRLAKILQSNTGLWRTTDRLKDLEECGFHNDVKKVSVKFAIKKLVLTIFMENRENASKSVWKATPNSFITLLFCVYNVFPDFLLCVLKKLFCLHFVSSLYSNSSTTTILEWVMLLAGISASAGSVLQSFNIIFHSIFQFSPFTNFTPHFTSKHSFLIFYLIVFGE